MRDVKGGIKLNIGQVKTKALQIIREYSSNGSLIGSGDNADYLLSMNGFINDAQFELCEARPIIASYLLPEKADSESTKYKRYKMPKNFKGLKEIKLDDETFTDDDWAYNYLVIPKCYEGEFVVWYFKFPDYIDNSIKDDVELEVDTELCNIIAYYAAGHSIVDENPDLAKDILQEYESKKRGIRPLKGRSKRVLGRA